MKKVFQFLLFSFLTITVTSCTEESSQEQLLTTIIEVNDDGTSETTSLTYNGNKIVSIVSPTKSETFTYTGDLITRVETTNLVNQQTSTLDYFYNNGNLIKIVSSENYELDFIHNSNATVNYEKVSNVNNVQVLEYHGTLYFQGDNAIEDKRVLDNTVSNELHKQEVRYNFDSKINPLMHITGYSKLLDCFATISANNAFSSIEIYSVNYLDTSQQTSSATLQPRSYQYDNNNYPTENVSEYPVFGPRYSNHLKSLYFYD